jgi:hypothetical protein
MSGSPKTHGSANPDVWNVKTRVSNKCRNAAPVTSDFPLIPRHRAVTTIRLGHCVVRHRPATKSELPRHRGRAGFGHELQSDTAKARNGHRAKRISSGTRVQHISDAPCWHRSGFAKSSFGTFATRASKSMSCAAQAYPDCAHVSRLSLGGVW